MSEQVPDPYVGPRPFRRNDEEWSKFFGRDREISEIVSLIISHSLVLVYAQSGAGKTSLFNAGIIPALEKKGFDVLTVVRVLNIPENIINVSQIGNVFIFNVLQRLKPDLKKRDLASKSLTGFLKEYFPNKKNAKGKVVPQVIIFDQLEELFIYSFEKMYDNQVTFFKQIADSLEDNYFLRIVFIIREDYLAQIDPFLPILPERLRPRFRLERLGKDPALLAVKGPLRNTGYSFEEGAAESLVENLLKNRVEGVDGKTMEVVGKFVDPVQLQVVCHNLWEKGLPTKITKTFIDQMGDVDKALEEFYERAIDAASKSGISQDELRQWFDSSLITSTGTRGIVHRGPQLTGTIPNSAVEILENWRLIIPEVRAGARWYELANDRLIRPIRVSNERRKQVNLEQVQQTLLRASSEVLRNSFTDIDNPRVIDRLQLRRSDLKPLIESTEKVLFMLAKPDLKTNEELDFAYLLTVEGKFEKALSIYDRILKNEPRNVRALNSKGVALDRLGYPKKAIAEYDRAIKIDPKAINPLVNKGISLDKLNKKKEAKICFLKAVKIEVDSNDIDNLITKGVAFHKLRRYNEAILQHTKVLKIDQNNGRALVNLGNALDRLGRYQEAISRYRKALRINQTNVYALYNMACTYSNMRRLNEALSFLKKTVTLVPEFKQSARTDGDFDNLRNHSKFREKFQNLVS